MMAGISAPIGSLGRCGAAIFIRPQAARPRNGRTHAWTPNSVPRTIHKLDSANKVVSCAVFFVSPQ